MPTPKYYKEEYFPQRRSVIVDEDTLNKLLGWADENYDKDDTDTRFQVAYTYYAAAEYLTATNVFDRASEVYHFAGHHLRSVDNLNNAAIAYVKGGKAAEQAAAAASSNAMVKHWQWAIRSYARATMCFSEIGSTEEAAAAYVAQQDAKGRLALAQRKVVTWALLKSLRLTSLYGQSATRIFETVAIATVTYGLSYDVLRSTLSSTLQTEWRWWSGYYYALVVALSFDPTVVDSTFTLTRWVALSNVVVAWILLGVGAALVARRVRER